MFNGLLTVNKIVDAIDGDVFSNNVLDLAEGDGQITWSMNMDQHRTGAINVQSSRSSSSFVFTVDADTTYSLSGNYTAVESGIGILVYSVTFSDITNGSQELFHNFQLSTTSFNDNFILGVNSGDDTNELRGSLTGFLLGGHTYELQTDGTTKSFFGDFTDARVMGNTTLKIGAIPEPATLAPFLLGFGSVGISRRRRIHSRNSGG